MRLNRFISNSGLCARRAADQLIRSGQISVNGQRVSVLGTHVSPHDIVKYHDRVLSLEKHIYLLLNKPKDYITTLQDPASRKTVQSLIRNACEERIYPVGRLDRTTTGLLLFTNDGVLAKRLAHPTGWIKKLYHVMLDKPIHAVDIARIKQGVYLDDGVVRVDQCAIVDGEDRRHVGIEIHMGRNRVVRRLFEELYYRVVKLDRVMYAHLTKKNLPRGKWRFLSSQEVSTLYQFSKVGLA